MTHIVTVQGYAYDPPAIQIASGERVKWRNLDGTRHSARRDLSPAFDTGLLSKDEESEEIVIEADPGSELEYYCQPHPQMQGKIIVGSAK